MTEADHARLLLAIVRKRWDEAEALARGSNVSADVFVELCRQADVPTWVHVSLQAEGREHLIGAEALGRLAAIRAKIRNDNLLLIARAEQALDVLGNAGIVPVALKGLDLLHRVYDGFDERTLDDVDLLIREDELSRAVEALESAGWRLPDDKRATHYIRSSHHLPIFSPGPVSVDFELHWNLAQEMRYAIDSAALIDRAVPIEIGGHPVLRLNDHDVVAHLLLHHFTHYFDRRCKWAVDLHSLASKEDFDWSVVARTIGEWGATAASGMSLVHLRKLFPEWISDEIVDSLAVAGWRRLLTAPLRSTHPLDLFHGTRNRWVQLYIATVMMERPSRIPRWLIHRATRDRRTGDNPLDTADSSD